MPLEVERSPRIPLRRSLVLSASVIVLISLAAFVASLYVLVYRPLVHELAAAQLGVVSEQVEARLRTLVSRAEAVARIGHDWGARGLIDIEHAERFNDLMRPVLRHGPQLSSVVVARQSGREMLLVHAADGGWINRLTDPQAWGRRARFLHWSADWRLQKDEWRELDYDARERPWFGGAMALASDEDIYWTPPYVFRSTQEAGLSAALRWTAPDGSRYAMSNDIKLTDLSRFTREITVGTSGFVAVFSGDGKLIAVPRDARFASDEAVKSAVLKAPAELGLAPLTAAFGLWRDAGAPEARLLRFRSHGVPWVAVFKRTRFGAQNFWVATMAPEADFAPFSSALGGGVTLLVLLTLLLASIVSLRLARRFAEPLERLAAQSARIGRLELEQPEAVHSPWRELDDLARAQEAMRVELLAATRRLAQAAETLEAKVAERTRELEEARDAADAASRAKADFLANMSHEIRTPMNAIIGMAHLAVRSGLPPRQHDYMLKIQQAGLHLLQLINDILDTSKIEAGKLTLEHSEFALDEVMDNVANLIGEKAAEKGLELVFDVAHDIPARLVGDPLRLGQVLLNYTNNAVKFTEKGEIDVVVRLRESGADDVLLEFQVRDTGVGLSDEQQGRLFQSFEQADVSTTRKYGGSGLGLAIAKRLAEMMGGEVGVRSVLGEGSTFWFTARLGKVVSERPERPALPMVTGRRALVVDDVAQARHVLTDMLSGLSIAVTGVDSGAAALAEFEAAQREGRPYDAVFLDWMMPGMDGLETARRIGQLSAGASVKPRLVMVTAYGREDVIGGAVAGGIDTLITKPVSASSLLDTVRRLFANAPPLRTPVPAEPPSAPIAALAGARILLAEDNRLNQEVALALLAEAGMKIDVVADGEAAVSRVREHEYDAVLLDMQMPVMDGLDAARAIRALPGRDKLPLIAMTANAMPEDRERCLAAGMNDHIAKPFDPARLWEILQRWIGPRAALPAAPTPAAAPASASVQVPRDIAGLDVRGSLQRLGGREALYVTVLKMFVSGQGGSADQIREALVTGDAGEARQAAHALRGAAANIGAQALADAAGSIESALAAHAPMELVESLVDALGVQLQALLDELRRRLPT
jgi:signal transduction histidine kinase/DNA-binding response OmpR family regulator/HPt (histidine-containing phosphotransfer) domain-containing protein